MQTKKNCSILLREDISLLQQQQQEMCMLILMQLYSSECLGFWDFQCFSKCFFVFVFILFYCFFYFVDLTWSYLYEFAPDLSGHHVAVPQVPHAEHEAQLPVPLRDHRVLTEHERLRAFLRLGHLDEHAADEKRVHYGAQQRLEQEEDDALRTLLRDVPVAVADSGLGLDEEQKSGGEVVNIGHARGVGRVVAVVQISPDVRDDPPHGCHHQPGDRVGEDEDEQVPSPLEVHQSGEEVREVPAGLSAEVSVLHVAATVLVHEALALLLHRRGKGGRPVCVHHLVVLAKFSTKCRHLSSSEVK